MSVVRTHRAASAIEGRFQPSFDVLFADEADQFTGTGGQQLFIAKERTMNRLQTFGMIVLSAALVSPLAAQGSKSAASDKTGSEKAIVMNEQKINDAVAKGDLNAFKSLVHKDAWSVDGGGVMSVGEFEKTFKQIKIDPGWKITDSKIVWIASNTAVHIYKWTGKGMYMGQPLPPVTFSSTIWHKDGDKWFAMFHQESAAAPGK